MSLILPLLASLSLAQQPPPERAPTVTPAGAVLDAFGALVWRPGLPTIRNLDGTLGWLDVDGVCVDPESGRAVRRPCFIDLGRGFTLRVWRSEGEPTTRVEVVEPDERVVADR